MHDKLIAFDLLPLGVYKRDIDHIPHHVTDELADAVLTRAICSKCSMSVPKGTQDSHALDAGIKLAVAQSTFNAEVENDFSYLLCPATVGALGGGNGFWSHESEVIVLRSDTPTYRQAVRSFADTADMTASRISSRDREAHGYVSLPGKRSHPFMVDMDTDHLLPRASTTRYNERTVSSKRSRRSPEGVTERIASMHRQGRSGLRAADELGTLTPERTPAISDVSALAAEEHDQKPKRSASPEDIKPRLTQLPPPVPGVTPGHRQRSGAPTRTRPAVRPQTNAPSNIERELNVLRAEAAAAVKTAEYERKLFESERSKMSEVVDLTED
ncbi:hypothetical protein B0A48_14668 [Cryoendolithus antarcticus]|uniref:Uncharacterized protein n=1 Tax=Cryoendolithus antarcticus TaxID=1507870 RepID=A0A1V8SK47_9PEZI|nr:hypothetical protein B0A48_14668 [Cryoendolithus antarcticus]